MLRSIVRILIRRIFGMLAYVGRVDAVLIPADEVVSAKSLIESNGTQLRELLRRLKIEVLYEEGTDFGDTYFVERSTADRLLEAIDSLQGEHYGVDVTFFMMGARRTVRVTSWALGLALRLLVTGDALEKLSLYRIVRGPGSCRRSYRAYASSIRFVSAENGWWVNPWSDVDSSPVQMSQVGRLAIPSATSITYPIDIVYTWVDGADPEWCARKDRALRSLGREVPRRSANRSRWENRDELLYSLRSVALFAPWIRNIYIVTDGQAPAWLDVGDSGKVRIVDHRQVFPDGMRLPNFNSHAIESVLHRIEGLAEHFIYMNDDFFFGAPVGADDFFTPSGLTKVFYSASMMPVGDAIGREKASEWGGINSSRLLEDEIGVAIRRKVKHTPVALRRSVLEEIEHRFPAAFARVRAAQFRSMEDVAPLTALYVNYAVATGHAVHTSISYAYLDIGEKNTKRMLHAYMQGSGRKVFCLNDTEEYEGGISWEEKDALVRSFLQNLYPWTSPWERQAGELALSSGREDEPSVPVPVTSVGGKR